MRIKRLGVLSCGKVSAVLHACGGLVGGLIFSLMFGAMRAAGAGDMPNDIFSRLFFSPYSIFALPIIYGIIGFIAGVLGAALYNLFAASIGGIEIEFGEKTQPRPNQEPPQDIMRHDDAFKD